MLLEEMALYGEIEIDIKKEKMLALLASLAVSSTGPIQQVRAVSNEENSQTSKAMPPMYLTGEASPSRSSPPANFFSVFFLGSHCFGVDAVRNQR